MLHETKSGGEARVAETAATPRDGDPRRDRSESPRWALGADPPRDIFSTGEFDPVFGRDAELARIAALWLSGRGVLAVSGGVGMGKTALARAAERALLDNVAEPPLFRLQFRAAPKRGEARRILEGMERGLRARGLLSAGSGPEPLDRIATRVAAALRLHRGLVILDGLEALQHPPHIRGGRVKNSIFSSFLESLASSTPQNALPCASLVLALGRRPLQEAGAARRMALEPLSPKEASRLLEAEGVAGAPDELRRLGEALEGCPLAVKRAARLIRRRTPQGQAARATDFDEIEQERLLFDAEGPIDFEARRAAEALSADVARLDRLPPRAACRGGPERALLAKACLAPEGLGPRERAVLLEPPAIPDMTETLLHLRPIARKARLDQAARRLIALGLLHMVEARDGDAGEEPVEERLAAPLLVRAVMRAQLKAEALAALRAAQARLSPSVSPDA